MIGGSRLGTYMLLARWLLNIDRLQPSDTCWETLSARTVQAAHRLNGANQVQVLGNRGVRQGLECKDKLSWITAPSMAVQPAKSCL